MNKPTLWGGVLLGLTLTFTACDDPLFDANKPDFSQVPKELRAGINLSVEHPDADQPLTITFKTPLNSPLYGYEGDLYAHMGVIDEGTWLYVPAEWTENIEKCKMVPAGEANVYSLTLSPSIRAFFSSGETPVRQIGFLVRSSDGSKQTENYYIDVTDGKYQGFTPGEIEEKPLPANVKEGINIVDNSTVTFVLYDKDRDGNHKDFAHITGDFNDWALTNGTDSKMYRDNAAGCWWITVGNLDATREYAFQYYVGTKDGEVVRLGDPYAEKILDPDNDKYIAASTYPESERQYPAKARGIVSVFRIQDDGYGWANPDFKIADRKNLMIYEMHFRDFTETGDINGAMKKLDYLQKLGVNAVELMPVQEFDGNDSWGYNPCYFFALDKAYGTKEMYKRFIDECHGRGMAVIFDVVYNHATGNNAFAKLYWDSQNNKTVANNPWFNVDAPHPFSVFHDFDHESALTRNFVKRNLEFLLEEYRIDGFRFDLTKGFTNHASNESSSSDYDQSRVDILTDYYKTIHAKNPDAVMICEHLAGIEEESALSKAGLLLWRNMNNAYCQSAMGYDADSGFEGLTTWNTSMQRDGWVGYMESHDEERCAYKQTAYAQEPLKSNLEARMAQLETSAAFFFTVSGPKMIWQFGELGYDISRDANQQGVIVPGEDHKTDRKPVLWSYYDDPYRKELYDTYSSLMRLRAQNPELFDQNAFRDWKVSATDWDNGRWLRLETTGGKKLVVAGNFSGNAVTVSNVLPSAGEWYDFETGKAENFTSTSVTVPAHGYRLYTNFSTAR